MAIFSGKMIRKVVQKRLRAFLNHFFHTKRQAWKIRVCAAIKAPVGLLSGRAVCASRWRGFAPTSSTDFPGLQN
ncbi:MAG TPA: hypothetical protein DCL93_08495 [Faecalibacterium sp.]|nr:hypothetical protein [Faecalibacterium sp.]